MTRSPSCRKLRISSPKASGLSLSAPSHTYAVAPNKNYQSFARVSYDVVPDVTAYAQGVFSRSKLHYITQSNSIMALAKKKRRFAVPCPGCRFAGASCNPN